jgi:hypothetical protein
MSDAFSSVLPGRYELFVGSADGLPVQEGNGTDGLLSKEATQASIPQGQRTTSQGRFIGSEALPDWQCFLERKKSGVDW